MAVSAKDKSHKAAHEWIIDKKRIAQQLLAELDILIEKLFSERNLSDFLQLLSRMPYFSYYNLLIIYNRYPKATCLAGFVTWRRIITEQTGDTKPKVLNSKGVNGGIDLLAPFTNDLGNGNYELTWYSVLLFDIEQTNAKDYQSDSPVFILDKNHLRFLLDSVSDILVSVFKHRVVYEPHNPSLISSGILGRMHEHTVSVRKDLNDEDTLRWLTESLIELYLNDKAHISAQSRKILSQCIHFCLYEIWGLENPNLLSNISSIIPKSERKVFLDTLQQSVFDIYQLTAGYYLEQRKESQELQDELTFILKNYPYQKPTLSD